MKPIISRLLLGVVIAFTALSYTPSAWFLRIGSLNVVSEGDELYFVLKRTPRLPVLYAEWTSEAVVLDGSGYTCPSNSYAGSGIGEFEDRPESDNWVRFSAEWMRECLERGPSELHASWRVIGPLDIRLAPTRIPPQRVDLNDI